MSISEKLERRAERPPLPSPDDARPGDSQPDAVDPSGYSLSDRSGPTGVHPVPGGALGEAGAAWTDQDFGPAVGLTRQHAIRPLEYTADRDSTPRSDSEVYRDVYGSRMPERGRDPGAD